MKATTAPALVDDQERYRWRTGSQVDTVSDAAVWFLSVCQSERRSEHTIRAYRGGFNRIAENLSMFTGHPIDALPLAVINRNDLGDAFAEYAVNRSPASQKQAWAVWNGLCKMLVAHEVLDRNPMAQVPSGDRPDANLARGLPDHAVRKLLGTLAYNATGQCDNALDKSSLGDTVLQPHPRRWWLRDYAMVLMALTTALRASELCNITFGDIASPYDDDSGARQILVKGKGRKERKLSIEASVVEVIDAYLRSRLEREGDARGVHTIDDEDSSESLWSRWSPQQRLFIQVGGKAATPGFFYHRLEYAYRAAGITAYRAEGALPHQLRHTVATMLADDPTVTPHGLKTFLGHSSLSSAERYTLSAGRATRATGRRNPVYHMVEDSEEPTTAA